MRGQTVKSATRERSGDGYASSSCCHYQVQARWANSIEKKSSQRTAEIVTEISASIIQTFLKKCKYFFKFF